MLCWREREICSGEEGQGKGGKPTCSGEEGQGKGGKPTCSGEEGQGKGGKPTCSGELIAAWRELWYEERDKYKLQQDRYI